MSSNRPDPLSVKCPVCGRRPGEECVKSGTASPLASPHRERGKLAKREALAAAKLDQAPFKKGDIVRLTRAVGFWKEGRRGTVVGFGVSDEQPCVKMAGGVTGFVPLDAVELYEAPEQQSILEREPEDAGAPGDVDEPPDPKGTNPFPPDPDKPMFGWDIHPAANLFPYLPEEEAEDLAADIKANGLNHPVVLNKRGEIVDGRNRTNALWRAGIVPVYGQHYVVREFTDEEAIFTFVKSENVHRRNITPGMKAMAAARLITSGLVASLPPGEDPKEKMRDRAARAARAGSRSTQSGLTVLHDGVKQVADLVDSGKLGVNTAADFASGFSKVHQVAILEEGGLWGERDPIKAVTGAVKRLAEAKALQVGDEVTCRRPESADGTPLFSRMWAGVVTGFDADTGAVTFDTHGGTLTLRRDLIKITKTAAQIEAEQQKKRELEAAAAAAEAEPAAPQAPSPPAPAPAPAPQAASQVTAPSPTWSRGDRAVLTAPTQARRPTVGADGERRRRLEPGQIVTVKMPLQWDKVHVHALVEGETWAAQVEASNLAPAPEQHIEVIEDNAASALDDLVGHVVRLKPTYGQPHPREDVPRARRLKPGDLATVVGHEDGMVVLRRVQGRSFTYDVTPAAVELVTEDDLGHPICPLGTRVFFTGEGIEGVYERGDEGEVVSHNHTSRGDSGTEVGYTVVFDGSETRRCLSQSCLEQVADGSSSTTTLSYPDGTRFAFEDERVATQVRVGPRAYLVFDDDGDGYLNEPALYEGQQRRALDFRTSPARLGDEGLLVRDVGGQVGGTRATVVDVCDDGGALMLETDFGAPLTLDENSLDAFVVTVPVTPWALVDRVFEAMELDILRRAALLGKLDEWAEADRSPVALAKTRITQLRRSLRKHREDVEASRPNPQQLDLTSQAGEVGSDDDNGSSSNQGRAAS